METTRVLVLDMFYQPHRIVEWETAVCMIYTEKAEIVETFPGVLRSPSVTMQVPAVIRMKKKTRTRKSSIKFSRENVLCRDGFQCQYCTGEFHAHELTYDHVLPRSRGGITNWENIVMACYACNTRKANRTPVEAGMPLLRTPRKPTWLPVTTKRFNVKAMPDVWRPYMAAAA